MMEKTSREKLFRLLRKIRRNFEVETFCRALKILDKSGKVSELIPNSSQKKLIEAVRNLGLQKKPIRILILKPRQIGFSTIIEAIIFMVNVLWPGISSLIMADKPSSTSNIYNIFERFYNHLPRELKRPKKRSNRKEMVWDDHEGAIEVLTAENDAPQSLTRQCFHGSEVAFWRNAETLLGSIFQMVPNIRGSFIFLESTANGIGNTFHKMWIDAKLGKNDYYPFFVAWYEHDEYELEGWNWEKLGILNEIELLLKEQGIDEGKIAWRRFAIRNLCNGSAQLFKQWYPANDKEAFLSSGRCPFDTEILNRSWEKTRNVSRENYDITTMPKDGKTLKTWRMEGLYKNLNGGLIIYDHPKSGEARYSIGVDPAEGKETGDNSAIQVIDRLTNSQAAVVCGKYNPEKLSEMAIWLGFYYGEAAICVERNNHGHSVIAYLKEYDYTNIYMQTTFDRWRDQERKEIGFLTSYKSKAILIDRLAEELRNGLFLQDEATISECLSFAENNGKLEAQDGCKDDLVMSLALAVYQGCELPRARAIEIKEKPISDYEVKKIYKEEIPKNIWAY